MKTPNHLEAKVRFFDNIYRASLEKASFQRPIDFLGRGTRVLVSTKECYQYMALYGGHHYYKLRAAYKAINFRDRNIGNNVEIIDWGCGQALATNVLIDYLIDVGVELDVSLITLIDPSKIALECGCNYIRQMFQDNNNVDSCLRTINKYLNDVKPEDFNSEQDSFKIHLFSNILDLETVDLQKLCHLMVDSFKGVNLVVCTSPDNAQCKRLDQFCELFSSFHLSRQVSSSEALYGEIFYALNSRFEQRRIGRYEKQFTVDLS